ASAMGLLDAGTGAVGQGHPQLGHHLEVAGGDGAGASPEDVRAQHEVEIRDPAIAVMEEVVAVHRAHVAGAQQPREPRRRLGLALLEGTVKPRMHEMAHEGGEQQGEAAGHEARRSQPPPEEGEEDPSGATKTNAPDPCSRVPNAPAMMIRPWRPRASRTSVSCERSSSLRNWVVCPARKVRT